MDIQSLFDISLNLTYSCPCCQHPNQRRISISSLTLPVSSFDSGSSSFGTTLRSFFETTYSSLCYLPFCDKCHTQCKDTPAVKVLSLPPVLLLRPQHRSTDRTLLSLVPEVRGSKNAVPAWEWKKQRVSLQRTISLEQFLPNPPAPQDPLYTLTGAAISKGDTFSSSRSFSFLTAEQLEDQDEEGGLSFNRTQDDLVFFVYVRDESLKKT